MALETSLMGGVNAFNSGIEGAIGNIQAADKQKTLGLLGQKLQGGDYDGAAQIAFSSGDANTGLKLLELKQSKGNAAQFQGLLGQNYPGESAAPAAPAASPQSTPAMPAPMGPLGSSANAIRSIESGSGQGNYAAIGPVTRDGDRAYGAYQVMGKNVGPWTQQVLGRAMTPQEFAADPKAQDAVFNTIFGGYQQKYGPEGAARAWFGGPGAVKGRDNVADVNGMTVARYGQKFSRLAGGQPVPTQVAALAPTTATDASATGLPPEIVAPNSAPAPVAEAETTTAAVTVPKSVKSDDGKKAWLQNQQSKLIGMLALPGAPTAAIQADIARVKAQLDEMSAPKYTIQTTGDGDLIAVNPKDPTDVQTIRTGRPKSMKEHGTRKVIADDLGLKGDRREMFIANGKLPEDAAATAAPANPFSDGAGKLTEGEGKAGGFTDRMMQAEAVLSGVAPEGGIGPVAGVAQQGTNWLQRDLHQAPFGLSNSLISSDQQKFNQAKSNFINSQLRRESGAAIGKEEYANADRQYFPQPGDSQEVIQQKAANRRSAIEAMGREAGKAYKPKINFREDGTLAPYGGKPAASAAAPVKVTSPQQARSLPSGTPIILPDGSQGVVP